MGARHIPLQGTQADFKNELLFSQFGINYNKLPEQYRKVRGASWGVGGRSRCRSCCGCPTQTSQLSLLSPITPAAARPRAGHLLVPRG